MSQIMNKIDIRFHVLVPSNLYHSINSQDNLLVPPHDHHRMDQTIYFLGSFNNFCKTYSFAAKQESFDPQQ